MTTTTKPGNPVPPAYQTCRVEGAEVFSADIHRGREYTEAELDTFIANFDKFGPKQLSLLVPPVVLGHEEDQEFLDRSDLPAAGYVDRLWREGNVLFADFADVPVPIGGLISAKAYRKVSIEHYDADRPFEATDGKVYPELIIRRIALLGGEVPQCKQLADLPVPVFSYADRQVEIRRSPAGEHCFAFSDKPNGKPAMKLDPKLFKNTRWAKCFADGAIDRAMLEEKLKPMFPGISDWSLFDENQLAMLALGATAPAAAPADPAAMADFDRPAVISELVAAGQDAATLEAMGDEELKNLYMQVTGKQFKDKPKPATPNPAVAQAFAEHKVAIGNLNKAKADLDAETARARQQIKEARKAAVAAFCDSLVAVGRLIPADRELFEPQLLAADDTAKVHKFTEDGKEVTVSELERLKRLLAARPVTVDFREKLKSGKNDDASELAAVKQFAEVQRDSLKAAGKKPEEYVHAFTELKKKKPTLTAREYGVPAEFCS